MSNGALFPNHVIMPEAVWQTEQWHHQQAKNHIERIRKAAEAVFSLEWGDNDADAVAALKRLESAINGS